MRATIASALLAAIGFAGAIGSVGWKQPTRTRRSAKGRIRFADGVIAAQSRHNRNLMLAGKLGPKVRRSDENGAAVTLIGPPNDRRVWLGGISARRGY